MSQPGSPAARWKDISTLCNKKSGLVSHLSSRGVSTISDVQGLALEDIDALKLGDPIVVSRLQGIVDSVDQKQKYENVLKATDLDALCLGQFMVVSSLQIRGILTLKHISELDEAKIKNLGLTDLHVQRRLIDYSHAVRAAQKAADDAKRKARAASSSSSSSPHPPPPSHPPQDVGQATVLLEQLEQGDISLDILRKAHLLLQRRKSNSSPIFRTILDVLEGHLDHLNEELGDEMEQKILVGTAARQDAGYDEKEVVVDDDDDPAIARARQQLAQISLLEDLLITESEAAEDLEAATTAAATGDTSGLVDDDDDEEFIHETARERRRRKRRERRRRRKLLEALEEDYDPAQLPPIPKTYVPPHNPPEKPLKPILRNKNEHSTVYDVFLK